MGAISNFEPLVKSIEELKTEARNINKNYRPQARQIGISDLTISDADAQKIGGKVIDQKKFCTAELGSRYIDIFVGNEREPKTFGDIVNQIKRVSYAEAEIIGGAITSPIPIRYMTNISGNKEGAESDRGEIRIESEGSVKVLSSNILSTAEKYTFSQYCSGILISKDGKQQLGLYEDFPTAGDSDKIDRYSGPGASFFVHRFAPENKSMTGMNFSLVDADILHAFFNGLGTLDLTKAVTHFRASFYSPAAEKTVKGKTQKAPPMSLASFLGLDKGVLQSTYGDSSVSALVGAAAGKSPYLRNSTLSRTGFELFLAPQTLVNPNINFGPKSSVGSAANRKFPVLDPMQPLASIDSFRITIQNSSIAAFSTQVAELKIIVHDKSRLEEMASMIAIQDFPSNFIEIEYGYNHPDSHPVNGSAVGRFLNLLKMVQVFTVAGYNISVKDRSAEITLKLVTLGDRALSSVPCITGTYIPVRVVTQYLESLSASTFSSVLGKESMLFDTKSSSGLMVSRKKFIELTDAVKATGGSLTVGSVLDPRVTQALLALQDSVTKGQFGEQKLSPRDLQTEMFSKGAAAFDIISLSTANNQNRSPGQPPLPDPFFEELISDSYKAKFRENYKTGKFVTAAQLLSRFVLSPLASSTIFDEVQIHTFSFNDRAGSMSKRPIASCPIDINLFTSNLQKDINPDRIFSTSEMLNKILKFCSNPFNVAFGVSDQMRTLKEARETAEKAAAEAEADEGAPDGERTPTAGEQTAQTSLTERLIDIYRDIEGVKVEDPVFKVPRVKFNIQSVKKTLESGQEINICKIIIYDEACTSLSDLSSLLGVAAEDLVIYSGSPSEEKGSNGSIDVDKTKDIRVVRELLKKLYPVIKPGIGNSVITSVNVASSTSGQVAQAQLIEALKGVYGSEQHAMPESSASDIDILPAKVSFTSIGCPVIGRGQSIFVDLGTGTSLDNVYIVSSVSHAIDTKGGFTTSVTLAPSSTGTVRSVSTKIDRALKKFIDSKS